MTAPLSPDEITSHDAALVAFIEKVRPHGSGCWEWAGSHYSNGYSRFSFDGHILAHRFAYERMVGPIPEGLVIDHRCRNRGCVNPRHMEAVSISENNMRGISPAAMNARKVACVNGHQLEGDNLIKRADGFRGCRECHRESVRRHRAKKKAAES